MSNVFTRASEAPFRILVGVDLADQASSGFALDEALRMASRVAGSEMHVVYVLTAATGDERSSEAAGLLRLYVSEKAVALGVSGPQPTGLHVRRGAAAQQIAQLAADVGADIVIVGTHKAPHLKALFMGSTAEHLMAATTCPVFVAGPRPNVRPSQVIAIEPPCPDCVQERFATRGRTWWCGRHSENHHLRQHHVYSYHSEIPFSEHDSEAIPTGSD